MTVAEHDTAAPATRRVIPAALRDANYRKQRDELLVEVQPADRPCRQAEREKVAASLPRCGVRSGKSKRRSDAIPPMRCCKSC